MADEKPEDRREENVVVEGCDSAPFQGGDNNDTSALGMSVEDLARQHGLNVPADLLSGMTNSMKEGGDPLAMMRGLQSFLGDALSRMDAQIQKDRELEAKENEDRNIDGPV